MSNGCIMEKPGPGLNQMEDPFSWIYFLQVTIVTSVLTLQPL